MIVTDEQLRIIIRTVQKYFGANVSPETMKYIVTRVVQKLSDEMNHNKSLPKHS
jgi:hypothetical protein